MNGRLLFVLGCTGLFAAASASAQPFRATIAGNGNSGRGKCTIEVVVDGAADVQITGDSATMRNLSGQRSQWRRFVCTERMPANPVNFRFSGVDGRGRQTLIRDPQNGGVAIVRIEDRQGGSEGYTFDFTWDARASGPAYGNGPGYRGGQGYGNSPGRDGPGYRPDYNTQYPGRQGSRRFTTEQAVHACQQEVTQRAANRFGGGVVSFRSTALDDAPGRRDWVVGTLDVRRGRRVESYRFSCSVNFDTGSIRSADIASR